MNIIFIIILLSFIQGFAEFLPISSAGHLLLIEHFLHFQQGDLVFDMALNLGTLLTIIVYFYKHIGLLFKEIGRSIAFKAQNYNDLLIIKLIIATIPVVIIGFLLVHFNIENTIRNPIVLGVCLIVFGIILYVVDKKAKFSYSFKQITYKNAGFIGLLQCLALVPGVSRSGITITAARLQGVNRVDAVSFSFLIAIPSTLGAVVLTAFNIHKHHLTINYGYLLLGIVLSFLFGLIFISWLLKFIAKNNFMIFMLYRIVMGLIIIIVFSFY